MDIPKWVNYFNPKHILKILFFCNTMNLPASHQFFECGIHFTINFWNHTNSNVWNQWRHIFLNHWGVACHTRIWYYKPKKLNKNKIKLGHFKRFCWNHPLITSTTILPHHYQNTKSYHQKQGSIQNGLGTF